MICLKLYYNKRLRDPIYYIQDTIRTPKGPRSVQVKRIGKHSELLRTVSDPLAYAQQVLAQMNAEATKPGSREKAILTIDLDKKVEYSKPDQISSQSTALNIGYFYLHSFYARLKPDDFFERAAAGREIPLNGNSINRFLVCAQLLNASSGFPTRQRTLPSFYERPEIAPQTLLPFLNLLHESYDAYMSHLFQYSGKIVKRDAELCCYARFPFSLETENADEDYVDEVTGEFIKGFRPYGGGSENRPVAEVGLFMDAKGIPVSMCVRPANAGEQTAVIPAEKELNRLFKGKSFVCCAEAGPDSEEIRPFDSLSNGFVIPQPVKTLAGNIREALLSDSGYWDLAKNEPASVAYLKTFDKAVPENRPAYERKVYKVISADPVCTFDFDEAVRLKNGKNAKRTNTPPSRQVIVVAFSRKQMEYQRFIRSRQVERAKQLLEQARNPEEIENAPEDIRRFITRKTTASAGNAAETVQDLYGVDLETISEDERYDGFSAAATDLPVMDENNQADPRGVRRVMDILEVRAFFERLIRWVNPCLGSHSVHLQAPEQLTAHLMICYTAFLLFRLIQVKLDEQNEVHFTSEDLLDTLKAMNIRRGELYCEALYDRSKVLDALERLTGLGLNHQYYLTTSLHQLIRHL